MSSARLDSEEFQKAVDINDKHKVMALIRNGKVIVTKDMMESALTSKPVSLCLILIGGFYKTTGVLALYEQASKGDFLWLDKLVSS